MTQKIKITRSPHDKENPFVQINRQLLRLPDTSLSLESRGALCYFLSFSDGWVFHPEKIKKDLKISDNRYRRIINELRKEGYFFRNDYLEKNMKRYEYFFSEFPNREWIEIYMKQENSNNFTDTTVSEVPSVEVWNSGVLRTMNKKEQIIKEEELSVFSPPVAAQSARETPHDCIEKFEKTSLSGEKILCDFQQLCTYAIRNNKDWSLEEIKKAWDILKENDGIVSDYFRFIEGTIDNLRKKKVSNYLNQGSQWKKKTEKNKDKKEMIFSEENSSKITSVTGSEMRLWDQ